MRPWDYSDAMAFKGTATMMMTMTTTTTTTRMMMMMMMMAMMMMMTMTMAMAMVMTSAQHTCEIIINEKSAQRDANTARCLCLVIKRVLCHEATLKNQRCYQDQGVRDEDQTKTRQAETETKTREAETKTKTKTSRVETKTKTSKKWS